MNDTVELLLLVGATVALTIWLSGRSNHGRGHAPRTTLASGAYGAPAGGPAPGGAFFQGVAASSNSMAGRRNSLARSDSSIR